VDSTTKITFCVIRIFNKSDIQEMGWGMNSFDLAQNRGSWRVVVNEAMNLRIA
jgi:hypothetical protein